MIFKGGKIFFFRSIFWIVVFFDLSLSLFFEANVQSEIIWKKNKIGNVQGEIIWEKYKFEKSKDNSLKLDAVKKPFAKDQKGASLEVTDLTKASRWRFRPTHQWYFDAQRKGGSLSDIQLLGGKIDWMIGDWWYLTGQGLSAYGGGSGSYSEGYWGVGVVSPSWKNCQIYGEILIGAGGGGGVDSGSSLLYKPSVGLEYSINKDFSLQTAIGKVISEEGNLDANTLDVSLVWRFGKSK